MIVEASGTQAATVGTEHTLSDLAPSVGKTFVLFVDTGAMVNGDAVELRVYTKVLSGGTERVAYGPMTYENLQGVPQKYSVPVPADVQFKATLKQTIGTGRSFPWKIVSL